MFEIFRDPIWQFVGAALGLLAIIVAVALYLKGRRRKSLSYRILSCIPLLSVKEEIKNGLRITYKNRRVDQVHLVLIKIFNSGNVPIPTKDYEQAITVSFGEKAKVLSSEIADKTPANLPIAISTEEDENKVVFKPTLLNEGDAATLKTLANNFDEVTVDGRVIGVKKIDEATVRRSPVLLLIVASAISGISTGWFMGMLTNPSPFETPIQRLAVFLVVVGSFMGVIHYLRKVRSHNVS